LFTVGQIFVSQVMTVLAFKILIIAAMWTVGIRRSDLFSAPDTA